MGNQKYTVDGVGACYIVAKVRIPEETPRFYRRLPLKDNDEDRCRIRNTHYTPTFFFLPLI